MDIAALTALYQKFRTESAQPPTSVPSERQRDKIRILILKPAASRDDLIECCLEECELRPEADYTALSYSWASENGDASFTRVIQLDDELHGVTENLYLALLRLRNIDFARRLWVDAVCINQNDENDKTRQVALMGQIYGLAKHVVAWLGEGESAREDEAAHAAMQCIVADKTVAPIWSPQRQQLRLKHTWLPDPRTNMGIPEQCKQCVEWDLAHPICSERYGGTSAQIPELRRAFMTLLRRRYFKRRWIIQEINIPAAGAVSFMWRQHSLPRTNFVSGQDVPFKQIPSDVFQLRNILIASKQNSLIDLVGKSHTTECSDPRDRLYALLSLADGAGITADYSRSVADVYLSFAELFVKQNRIGDLLQACSGARAVPSNPIDGLPSWVPDLRDQFSPQFNKSTPGQIPTVHNGILQVDLYKLGVLGAITEDETNFYAHVLDDVTGSGVRLGQVKIYRHGNTLAPQTGDVPSSQEIPTPYMAGSEIRAWARGFLLRPVDKGRWRIVNRCEFGYINHEYRPYEEKGFAIV